MTKPLTLVACGVLVLIATAVTNVAAGPQANCLVAKNKCVTEKAARVLECEQKAETPGSRQTRTRVAASTGRTPGSTVAATDDGLLRELENMPNGCFTFDDTASVEMLVDACVAEIVETIDPASIDQSRCGVGKKKCAAKTLKSILKCHQKAETLGRQNDPNFNGCLDKAKTRFDGGSDPTKGCFERLENKSGNDCLPPLDNGGGGGDHRQFLRGRVRRGPSRLPRPRPRRPCPPTTRAATTGGFCWFLVRGADRQRDLCVARTRVRRRDGQLCGIFGGATRTVWPFLVPCMLEPFLEDVYLNVPAVIVVVYGCQSPATSQTRRQPALPSPERGACACLGEGRATRASGSGPVSSCYA